jgi:serine/threonine protein kinase
LPPDHVSKEARLLLNKMLIVDPDRRATAAMLLEDSWLKSRSNPTEKPKDINTSQMS